MFLLFNFKRIAICFFFTLTTNSLEIQRFFQDSCSIFSLMSCLFMNLKMELGTYRPSHKTADDYVIWGDLQRLLDAFNHLRTQLVESQQSLAANSEEDWISHWTLGLGSVFGFLVIVVLQKKPQCGRASGGSTHPRHGGPFNPPLQ